MAFSSLEELTTLISSFSTQLEKAIERGST